MTERRDAIIAAARELVAEAGMGSLSVRAVAARAGIGASTLRHYFPTQQDLYDAVLGASFEEHLADLRIRDTGVAPALRLTECLWQFLPERDADDRLLEQWLAQYLAVLSPDASGDNRRAWEALVKHGRQRIIDWLQILADEGLLRDDDPARPARLLVAVVDGLALDLITPGYLLTHDQADEVITDAVRSILR